MPPIKAKPVHPRDLRFKKRAQREPLWSGPCGQGPQGGITQSIIARWLQCRERARLYLVEGLKPREERFRLPIDFGSLWHTCEEFHARDKDWKLPLRLAASTLCQRFPNQQQDVAHWTRVIETQFPVYLDHWSKHEHARNREPIFSEQVFDVPYELPSGKVVRLRGKWDSVDRVGDGIWLQENKTKSKIDPVRIKQRLSRDLQTMTYFTTLQEELRQKRIKERLVGVRYNVIRRDCPISRHKAKQNKAKNTYTPEETEDHFYARLRDDYFLADPDGWFMRWECNLSSADVERFRRETLDPILESIAVWWEHAREDRGSDLWRAGHYLVPYGAGLVDDYDDYSSYLESGSEVGYERTNTLFPELEE